MRSDPDFAEPIVDKPLAPSSGTTLAWTWLGVALVNMLVPGGLGLLITFKAGLVGMALGIAAVLGLGWYAAHIVPQVVRTVVHGGWIVAVVQFFPLLQIAAGSVGVEIVKALGSAEDSNPTIGTVSGGFLATIITADLLIALAWMLGYVGRAGAFLVRRVGGGSVRTDTEGGVMGSKLPRIFLVRHGETEWSAARRHTSMTDIPLTKVGEADARRLASGLRGWTFSQVLTSPLQRAFQTCELSGFADGAEVVPDLVEFRYGDYEGLTTAEIRARRPGWAIFRDGCPGGDSIEEASARADRVVARLREAREDVAVFSHAHFIRSLAARWIGLEIGAAARFTLATASVSILGYDHNLDEPVIRLWNDVSFRGGVPE